MRLRNRIFRRLVLVALIPSIIIASVAGYFLSQAIDQASGWISISSPDRTINSLWVTETRLGDLALEYLQTSDIKNVSEVDSLFDWCLIVENKRIVDACFPPNFNQEEIEYFYSEIPESGKIRRMTGDHLILGASLNNGDRIIACGFIFDKEYINGFEAAAAALRESRRFQNLLPGFTLFFLAAGAAVLVLIIVGAYLISRRLAASVTTPLEQLTAVTAGVARGDKAQSISITGTEEISRLTETFNRMIDDLEESRKRLMAAERVAAWQEFARRMAHELKNPLTPISLSLYRIKKSLEESGHYDRFADSIEAISAEVAHLERMANDYSSLAKLPEPRTKEFDFTLLVNDLLRLHAAQLEDYDFEKRITADPISLEGDPDHLHQVMVNLLKNAMEFTSAGGKISVGVSADERTVLFEVANEGKDVSEADLKAAKLPYFSTREGGTGLGLAVSEKIIIDHGGSLSLILEKGMTVASVEIPRKQTSTLTSNI